MPLYGLLVVRTLPTIRRNNCDRLLRASYKVCIMDWDVVAAPSLADSSCATLAQVLHSVATVQTTQDCIVEFILLIPVLHSHLKIGIICIFVLGGFVFINFYRKEEGFVTDIPQTEDPHKVSCDFSENVTGTF